MAELIRLSEVETEEVLDPARWFEYDAVRRIVE
jgi:hypothetical protein